MTNHQQPSDTNNASATAELLDLEIQMAGGMIEMPAYFEKSVGVTMFDLPNSQDNLVAVVVQKRFLQNVPNQSLVRIGHSDHGDHRVYQGIVVRGPFYMPDGMRPDASVIVATSAQGIMFMPKYHGQVFVEILADITGGSPVPPQFRPLPNSPVYPLTTAETVAALNPLKEDQIAVRLGLAIGHEALAVSVPADTKAVLPRHLAVLGTTGGGKSTTVSGLVNQFQKSGIATILIDTEGEYTHLNEATDDPGMLAALAQRGLSPQGVENTQLLHLVEKDTMNPKHPSAQQFSLAFEQLSRYAIPEILEFTEAQESRFQRAYDKARELILKLGLLDDSERNFLADLDEFQRGFPKMKLSMVYDIVQAVAARLANEFEDDKKNFKFTVRTPEFKRDDKFRETVVAIDTKSDSLASWRALQGKLGQLLRLKVFDHPTIKPFDYDALTQQGTVSIIDLSDTASPQINNIVIAELLRGLMERQNADYKASINGGEPLRKIMVVIEEAHEFLSRQRIAKMENLFNQVALIAKRGRKRWLGLAFVTQLPQHLPDDVLALVNNFVLHKISDSEIVSRLRRTVGGVDDTLWDKLKNLSPGQAVVKTQNLRRALLTSIDPTPCKLLMAD